MRNAEGRATRAGIRNSAAVIGYAALSMLGQSREVSVGGRVTLTVQGQLI
jgi:hypothetical protein